MSSCARSLQVVQVAAENPSQVDLIAGRHLDGPLERAGHWAPRRMEIVHALNDVLVDVAACPKRVMSVNALDDEHLAL
jgi:hypothetical protein